MTDLKAELNLKWTEALSSRAGGHEWRAVGLSIIAPVRIFAAVREPDDRITLLIEAPLNFVKALKFRFRADGLSVTEYREIKEQLFRLAVTLEREDLRDVFEVLAIDIIEVIRKSESPLSALTSIGRRLDAWQAFLKSGRRGLTRAEQIGLAGELIVLRELGHLVGYSDAVEAWQGPTREGIHDFSKGGFALEVKTVLGVGNHLHISRLDQLETTGLTRLLICRPRFREHENGATLPVIISEIRSEILAAGDLLP